MKRLLAMIVLLATSAFAQETRIASDFEIAQTRAQIARSRDFLTQLSGHLNLGDLYTTRNETATAREEYARALAIAMRDRVDARRGSDMTRYSTATGYAGLAQAKLGRGGDAFALLDESIRYAADSAKSWNVYASAMTILDKPAKAVAAARNAVAIAERDLQREPSLANRLDLAIDRYTLANAGGEQAELRNVVESLRSPAFEPLRRQVAREEAFEIYSTARGEAAAYLSLLNRAQLRLAAVLEAQGDTAGARREYERVLETRTDDPAALTALARLAPPAERERYFAAAFDANPFSLPLIRTYQRYLGRTPPNDVDDSSTGGKIRSALIAMRRGETRSARTTLDALLARFPKNETLRTLRAEASPQWLAEAGERQILDAKTFTGTAVFNATPVAAAPGQTVFESGTIDGVPFRFAEPVAFAGTFAPGTPLRLTYRILGATDLAGADAMLLEPLRLEATR